MTRARLPLVAMHVVGTAGHVDHGKSTLVHALTGIDPDRFEEEKRRGLTIDLGFAWLHLPSGREIGIVDVPGHERFIRNMLAGVGGIDAAIFVVAADEGWMPQSTEHLHVLDFLDVGSGVVALTKSDLATKDSIERVTDQIHGRLTGTSLEGSEVVAVSATTGTGLDELRAAVDRALDATGERLDQDRPRLFIDRSFTISGAGTVVTGTLTGGRLQIGDEAILLPDERRARIRSLQTHRANVDIAVPGSRVAVNLVGLDRTSAQRGHVLVTEPWHMTTRFAARVRAASGLDHPLDEKGAYEVFAGSAQTACRLRFLDDDPAPLAEIFIDRPLPLIPGDRFVVRDLGRWETVAGGIVVDTTPARLRRTDRAELARLRHRESLRGAELAAWMIEDRGIIARHELEALTGAGSDSVAAAIDQGKSSTYGIDAYIVSHEKGSAIEATLVSALEAFHSANHLAPGMPLSELSEVLGIDRSIFGELSSGLTRAGVIAREGNVVRLTSHADALTPEQRSAADKALQVLRTAHASPPSLKELGLSYDLARAMARTGELVMLTADIAYPADVLDDLRSRVVGLIGSEGPATVSKIREALGTSRKFALPLLASFDAEGITKRDGDVRDLGPRGRELADYLRG